ncbi:hypothetical protein F5Y09DRAFT_354583 [Xylaria sp. FL1042]|nr:hypothetical protein F5Y09DRAFT_354583 [Xylaria sp. FL1042]
MGHQLTAARLYQEDWIENLLDVVSTQGKHLLPRLDTPVWEKPFDKEFASTLADKLDGLVIVQRCRQNQYDEAADEWPIGHTPPEMKERHEAKLRKMDEWFGLSDDAYDSYYWAARGEHPHCGKRYRSNTENKADPEEDQTSPEIQIQAEVQGLREVSPHATPSSTSIVHTARRHETTKDKEEERSTKIHIASNVRTSFPEEENPSSIQTRGRKRRHDGDTGDTGHEGGRKKGRLAKVRKPAIPTSKWWGMPINTAGLETS